MKIPSFPKKINYFSLFAAVPLFIIACAGKSNGSTGKATADSTKTKDTLHRNAAIDTNKNLKDTVYSKIATDRKYNDIARFIAGMKSLPGSPYANLENDSAWIKLHKSFDTAWTQVENNRLKKMSEWGARELAQERSSGLDIFYPLSGPDILHANALFPNAKNYRLFALEINGALPNLDKMKKKGIENYVNDIYVSLGDVFKRSYFITHRMNATLGSDNVNGTIPLICVFLVRSGHEIINLQYYHLNDDGTETALKKDSIGSHHNDFVKIWFKNSNNNSVQMVSYMKCDLSDAAYAKNSALKNYQAKMPLSITYLKSASYLLHYKFFTSARDLILSKSKSILEDDTGIPYKYLPGNKWQVTLYGVYVKPVSDFSGVFQEDLLKAYQDTAAGKPKKLPFSLGYHWGTNEQNLIKAQLRN